MRLRAIARRDPNDQARRLPLSNQRRNCIHAACVVLEVDRLQRMGYASCAISHGDADALCAEIEGNYGSGVHFIRFRSRSAVSAAQKTPPRTRPPGNRIEVQGLKVLSVPSLFREAREIDTQELHGGRQSLFARKIENYFG